MKTQLYLLTLVTGLLLTGCASEPVPAPVNPSTSTTIINVTIIEPGTTRLANQTITVTDGVITGIRPATKTEKQSNQRYVIPGLIDMHTHQPVAMAGLEDYFELLYLKHGVTAVRYTGYGSTGDIVKSQKAMINEGTIPGPRIFSCGPIIDGSPPIWPAALAPSSPQEAQQLVTRLAAEGMDCIKIYSNITADILDAIVKTAEALELPVVGHVPRHVGLAQSGLDDAQHMIGVAGNHADHKDINPMVDGWDHFSESRLQAVISTSLENEIAHTPTLVFLWTNAIRDKHKELIEQTDAHLLPLVFPELFWLPKQEIRLGGERTPEMQEALRKAYEAAKHAVAAMHSAGVRIHAGTDVGNPFVVQGSSLIKEIELLSGAGLGNEHALAAATSVAGKSLGVSKLGTIQVGAPADLLVLTEDPIRDLSALHNPELVVAQGRSYDIKTLNAEVERYRNHYSGFMWDTLIPAIASLFF